MQGAKIFLLGEVKENMKLITFMIIIFVVLWVVSMVLYKRRLERLHKIELKEIEEKAEATRIAAEKAQRAKTDFLFQMSHDIRTPMNAIIGFTKFAKELDDLDTIKKDYIPKIETASNQLLMLINDVLEMSRIESGKMKFTRGDYDVIAMLESVITVMEMQAEEKGLSVELNTNVQDRYVHCDENHLNRVLMNLMSNAVKFTPFGGKITVSVEQKPDENPGYASYEIKIADTGIGMSEEFIGKVFEPFERERTSTVSRMQGTGLGMAIVKSIVDAADDTITVESKLGEGTTFTLNAQFLLINDTENRDRERINKIKKAPSSHELRKYFSGKRILLAEDNEFNSAIAENILENAGFIVETAEDGHVTVQKVINAPRADYYDFILMDIQMPVMDGYEATEKIRQLEDERSKVKILAVTANAFDEDKNMALQKGMDGHVPKPLDVNVLYNTLLEVYNNK